MEDNSATTNDKRRSELFRPIAMLIAGAFLMLVVASYVQIEQLSNDARTYEKHIVNQSWQQTMGQISQLAQSLAQQKGADQRVKAGDRGWVDHAILGPLRAQTGARGGWLRRAPAGAQAGAGLAIVQGAPHWVVTTGLGQNPAAGRYDIGIPLDPSLTQRFGAHHDVHDILVVAGSVHPKGYNRLRLGDHAGRPVASLIWATTDPFADLASRLPALLAMFGSLFTLCVWYTLRKSTTVASDLIASEARARHLAFHDTLTGLPNRAMMFDRLRQLLALSRRYYGEMAVHCLDLDRFKEVNDLLGHPAGDELIRQVADRITNLCRDSDTVARLGGDEFVILQPETNAAGASHLAERVLRLFEDPFVLEAGTVEVGVSIGVTLITNPEIEAEEALRQSDLALYGSKEGGRNRVTFFEPDMDAALRMRRSLETDLRHALANDGLTMVYQPQMDAKGLISAMEALVRWEHPEKGAIGPSIFVPLCEESGLILDLGEYVFNKVFEETGTWINTRVAINVSALQLRSPMFMATLTRLVAEHHVDPARYEIEITETALLGDDGVTRDNIIMLKQEGFSIALDDFGTGYSSLNSLKRFAVDKIKIDRSFVHNLEANEEAEGLVDAIVKLGRALKLDIVAEGVETEHQRERLAACGCNSFQGYLVSRPVPASQLQGLFLG